MEELAALFPAENWMRLDENLYIAQRRQNTKNKNEQQKLDWEIEQAKILAGRGHTVFLVPETGSGKHYDALVDGVPTELKRIKGGIHALRRRFTESRKQAKNVFLLIENKETLLQTIRNVLKGEIKQRGYKDGTIYVYVNGKFARWSVNEDLS